VALVGLVVENDELVGAEGALVGGSVGGGGGEERLEALEAEHLVLVEIVDHGAVGADLDPAGVEAVGVDLLVLEVLGDDAEGVALDAGGDVLGDEDGAVPVAHQVEGDGDDLVVGLVVAEEVGPVVAGDIDADGAGAPVGADGPPGHGAHGGVAPADALGERADEAEAVEVADDLAGGSPDVVVAPLHVVQFLDHGERDDDIVVLEDEQGVRVVQEHIGVEDEMFGLVVVAGRDGVGHVGGASGPWRGGSLGAQDTKSPRARGFPGRVFGRRRPRLKAKTRRSRGAAPRRPRSPP
jgi:hypothetical protein